MPRHGESFEIESVDFSRPEEQKESEKQLGDSWERHRPERIIEETRDWAAKVKERVDRGEAADYESAEKLVARKAMDRRITKLESAKGVQCATCYYERGDDFSGLELGFALQSLPFDEALQDSEKVLKLMGEKLQDMNEKPSLTEIEEAFGRAFLRLKVKPGEELDKFLKSPMERLVSPELILKKMGEEHANEATAKKLLKKYDGRVDISKVDLFGSTGILESFSTSEKQEMLGKVITDLEDKVTQRLRAIDEALERNPNDPWYRRYGKPGVQEDEIETRLKHLAAAAKEGIILPNYEEHLTKIRSTISNVFNVNGSATRYIRWAKEELERVGMQIEKVAGRTEGITGRGLEFSKSKYGNARRVYLDGELIGSFADVQFGKNSTNGEVVTWMVSEVIDQDRITGTQNRDTVYVWKKGWKEPRAIFEDHAWSTERYMRVLPPKITPDGKVKITRISGEKEKEEIIDPSTKEFLSGAGE